MKDVTEVSFPFNILTNLILPVQFLNVQFRKISILPTQRGLEFSGGLVG